MTDNNVQFEEPTIHYTQPLSHGRLITTVIRLSHGRITTEKQAVTLLITLTVILLITAIIIFTMRDTTLTPNNPHTQNTTQ